MLARYHDDLDDGPNGSITATKIDGQIDGFLFICPCGCRARHSIDVRGQHKWNGNMAMPTIYARIQIKRKTKCQGWRGWLERGEWKEG